MDLDDLRETDNVDDRRGAFGGYGPHLAVGGGGLGLVGVLLVSLLFGVNPAQLLSPEPGAGQTFQPDTSAGQPSALAGGPRAEDADLTFARKIVGSAEDVWTPLLQAKGVTFTPATFTVYDRETPTGCGDGQSSAGPFYCPTDRHIYLDLAFFQELATRFGVSGDFARAYVIAHEFGHHVQNLLGTMDSHDASVRGATGTSVRTELQADCYAGVWAFHANQQFHILQDGDVDSGLKAASAVGDDTLEKQQQGYVVPDSFTHGTSEQRTRWFQRGLSSGNMDMCDTFSASRL